MFKTILVVTINFLSKYIEAIIIGIIAINKYSLLGRDNTNNKTKEKDIIYEERISNFCLRFENIINIKESTKTEKFISRICMFATKAVIIEIAARKIRK